MNIGTLRVLLRPQVVGELITVSEAVEETRANAERVGDFEPSNIIFKLIHMPEWRLSYDGRAHGQPQANDHFIILEEFSEG